MLELSICSGQDDWRREHCPYPSTIILQDAKYTRMLHASRRHNVIFKSDDSSTYVAYLIALLTSGP
jgi:hypothetical protein